MDYSPRELKWLQEEYERKEAEKREAEHRDRIEHLKEVVLAYNRERIPAHRNEGRWRAVR